MRKKILVLLLLCTLPLPAFGQDALEAVRENINQVLLVLKDPGLSKDVKKSKIESIARQDFDFQELSRRTLAVNWKKLDPAQQKEFVELYRTLLEETYANRILSYSNEKIVVSKQVPLSENTVEVRSTIVSKTGDIPVNYRLTHKGETWKVYDVVIEGVSLISNYRSQFREIMSGGSPESLLQALRKKVGKA